MLCYANADLRKGEESDEVLRFGMLIENNLEDQVDFFHVDALSSAVALKVDFDVTLTVIATGLYPAAQSAPARLRARQGAHFWARSSQSCRSDQRGMRSTRWSPPVIYIPASDDDFSFSRHYCCSEST